MKNRLRVISKQVEISTPEKGKFGSSIRRWHHRLQYLGDLPEYHSQPYNVGSVGIDPGMRTGVAILYPTGEISVYLLKMPPKKHMGRLERMRNMSREFVSETIGLNLPPAGPVVIEDAAFGRLHGQVALAESRTAAMLGMMSHGSRDYYLVNPRSLWKRVFGSAKVPPKELWEHLGVDDNVLDAVAAALYGVFEYGF